MKLLTFLSLSLLHSIIIEITKMSLGWLFQESLKYKLTLAKVWVFRFKFISVVGIIWNENRRFIRVSYYFTINFIQYVITEDSVHFDSNLKERRP